MAFIFENILFEQVSIIAEITWDNKSQQLEEKL